MKGIVALAFVAGLALGLAAALGMMWPGHLPPLSSALPAAVLVDQLRALHQDLSRHLVVLDAHNKFPTRIRQTRQSTLRMKVSHVRLLETLPAVSAFADPVVVTKSQSASVKLDPVLSPPKNSSTTAPAIRQRPYPAPSDRHAYAEALQMYESGQYAQSRARFDKFVCHFAHSALIPNALYWIGETWYAQGRYAQAERIFVQVVTRYPRHSKGADALLKAAYSALRCGNQSHARNYLQRLQAEYCGSSAANLGRRAYDKLPRLASGLETTRG